MDNFDSLVDDNQAAAIPAATPQPTGTPNFDSLQDDEEKYGTLGQTALTGVEGAARGVIGPLAPVAEKALGVKPEDILAREKTNPITHAIGETAGLAGSTLLTKKAPILNDLSLAGVMSKAGTAAQEAVGLANVAKEASWGARVGSAAVQQAAEMAIMQGSDEAAKMIMKDPDTSAQSAVSNIGLAAALGAGGATFLTGAVSPLWQATAGPKVEKALSFLKNSRGSIQPAEHIAGDLAKLGVELTPLQAADLSENATAQRWMKDLSRAENPAVIEAKADLQKKVSDSVMEPLNTTLEEMKTFDAHTTGKAVTDKLVDNIEQKMAPLWERLDTRDAEAAKLAIDDDARLQLRDRIIERGFQDTAGNSKYLKTYTDLADQVLEQDTLRGFDKMDTQLYKASKNFTQDANVTDAQRTIRGMLKDFKNQQIESAGTQAEKLGIPSAKGHAADLKTERAALNAEYSQAEKIREELGDHFGITRPENSRQFMRTLKEEITPEKLLKKFSLKNNMDGAKFLENNFPEIHQMIVRHEQKELLKPAILAAAKKGEVPIDINKLNGIIEKARGGNDQYLKAVLPPEFIARAESASRILGATTKAKDSGTPAGMWGLFKHAGASAIATIGYMMGHNPISSAILGEMATTLGKDAPEAAKLALLRFFATDSPVNPTAFKAAFDFIHAVQQNEKQINKAVGNVFKPGVSAIISAQMPSAQDLAKLDKTVTSLQQNPGKLLEAQKDGQLGHYLPQHQVAAAQASATALQYLQSLKPHPQQLSPLDSPIPPSAAEKARYDRALSIAQQPAVVLQHIKDGTLQANDVGDLKSLYPSLYSNMAKKLSMTMVNHKSNEEPIPYKTRMSLSLFLGQPLDSTMTPQGITSAQPKPTMDSQQAIDGKPKSGSPSKLGKTINSYRTPMQSSESDRANRD